MTIEQLAVKVLSKLGIHQAGSPPQAADLENVTDAYQGVYYTLLDDGLVTWALMTGAEYTDIPIRFSLPLIDLIYAEIAHFYNLPSPPEGWGKVKQSATNTIRRQLASGQPTEVVAAEYF